MQGTKVRGVPAARPAIVVSRTSRARASGSSSGASRQVQPSTAGPVSAAQSTCSAMLRIEAGGEAAGVDGRWIRAATRSSICWSRPNPCHCSVMAGTLRSTNIRWKNSRWSFENW